MRKGGPVSQVTYVFTTNIGFSSTLVQHQTMDRTQTWPAPPYRDAIQAINIWSNGHVTTERRLIRSQSDEDNFTGPSQEYAIPDHATWNPQINSNRNQRIGSPPDGSSSSSDSEARMDFDAQMRFKKRQRQRAHHSEHRNNQLPSSDCDDYTESLQNRCIKT